MPTASPSHHVDQTLRNERSIAAEIAAAPNAAVTAVLMMTAARRNSRADLRVQKIPSALR
jgi:hypothetical protein